MANELQNKSPADTYKDVLHLGTATTSTPGTGLPPTTGQVVYDGAGSATKLKLSQSKIEADNIYITNGTITSLAAPLAIAQGGTGGSSTALVKSSWGIDNVENTAISTWAGSNQITTLGTISTGVWEGAPIEVANGGTGGSDVNAVKTSWGINNVENTPISTWTGSPNLTTLGTITSGEWSGTLIPLNKGGTGASTALGAQSSLGLGSLATQADSAVSITGGTLANVTISSAVISGSSLSGISDLTVDSINLNGSTIDHVTPGASLVIPNISSTEVVSNHLSIGTAVLHRLATSTLGQPTLSIVQYGTESEDLISVTDQHQVTKTTLQSTGTIKANQIDAERFIDFRGTQSVDLGGSYSVSSADLTTVESHSSTFTTANIAVGDLIRIKASAGGTYETREVLSRVSDSMLTVTKAFTFSYTNSSFFIKYVSSSSRKFSVENDGSIGCGCPGSGGAWDTGHLRLGSYHIWVDSTGNLRMKNGVPTSDTDGNIVGTQS